MFVEAISRRCILFPPVFEGEKVGRSFSLVGTFELSLANAFAISVAVLFTVPLTVHKTRKIEWRKELMCFDCSPLFVLFDVFLLLRILALASFGIFKNLTPCQTIYTGLELLSSETIAHA